MFDIAEEWKSWRAGAIIDKLLTDLTNPADRLVLSRYMIRASLDLFVCTIHLNKGLGSQKMMVVTERRPYRWKVGHNDWNKLTYVFIPEINDEVLWKWQKSRFDEGTSLIVPSNTEFIFKQALHDVLKNRTPTVSSLDGFISWRVSFGSLDARWSRHKTILWLLQRYNTIIKRLRNDDTLLVRLPRFISSPEN